MFQLTQRVVEFPIEMQLSVNSMLTDPLEEPGNGPTRAELEDPELTMILGPTVTVMGDISLAGRARIDGRVEGNVMGGELVIIGRSGTVQGQIEADAVVVLGGQVQGNISARLSIDLNVPAKVKGDLRAPQIRMERGVVFSGKCDIVP